MSPACAHSSRRCSLARLSVPRTPRIGSLSSSHSVTKWLSFIANSPAVLDSCSLDRLLWVWFYRVWPRCLEAMVLVNPVAVVQWHRQGFGLYWRWRSRSGRRPASRKIRKLIRQMCLAKPCSFAPRFTSGLDEIFGSDTHRFQSLRNNDVRLASCAGVGGRSSRCAKGIMRRRQFCGPGSPFLRVVTELSTRRLAAGLTSVHGLTRA
jgi:hypothetical protein